MTFLPENDFERSLLKASEDPAYLPQFYRDLVEADFFIVQYGPPPQRHSSKVLQEDSHIEIQDVEFNGKPCLPVFSSLLRLQEALREEAGYMALNALEFMRITRGADLFLNPGADFGKEFTKEEIQSIIDGSIWQPSESYEVERDTQIIIGQPENYPHDLVDALSRLFKETREVKQAYLSHFFNPENDEKAHTLIGIEVSGNWDEVRSQVGLVAAAVEVPDPPVDLIQITGRGGVEDYFLQDCEPFYKKKRLGLF